MATTLDLLNDQLQQYRERQEARKFLKTLPINVLAALCDLNHLDDEGSRSNLISRLLNDKFGELR